MTPGTPAMTCSCDDVRAIRILGRRGKKKTSEFFPFPPTLSDATSFFPFVWLKKKKKKATSWDPSATL
jgi:hypothetical protein